MALGVVGMGRNSRMFAGMRRFENFFLLKKTAFFFSKCLMRFAHRALGA